VTGGDVDIAAATLWEHWQQSRRLRELPERSRPSTRADGYAIQSRLAGLSGQAVVGWKIAATSAAGQAHIRVDGPLAGRLLDARVLERDAVIPLDGNLMRVAEADACACWFILGPAVTADWRAVDLAQHQVEGYRNAAVVARGSGANVLGDPRVALAWIANELRSLQDGLRAGQIVTTGTCIVPIAVAPGDRTRMDFGVLGSIDARFC
jgi:2-keto-4-pentenoate hydratase